MKRARKKFKPLNLTPATKGSGLRDVSQKHDYYLGLGLSAEIANSKSPGKNYRTCPVPTISYFEEVSSASAKGPRQCNFWVLMPISAPKPNSAPSVKRVEAFQYTAAESTPRRNLRAFTSSLVTMESECFVE